MRIQSGFISEANFLAKGVSYTPLVNDKSTPDITFTYEGIYRQDIKDKNVDALHLKSTGYVVIRDSTN